MIQVDYASMPADDISKHLIQISETLAKWQSFWSNHGPKDKENKLYVAALSKAADKINEAAGLLSFE